MTGITGTGHSEWCEYCGMYFWVEPGESHYLFCKCVNRKCMTDRNHYIMTTDREAHLGRIISWFGSLVTPKYRCGQEEHGGTMYEKSGMFKNLKDETIDFVTYVQTIEEQLKGRFPDAYQFLMAETETVVEKPKRKRPRVYVAGRYSSADDDFQVELNIYAAAVCAHMIWSYGGAALCPHKNTERFEGPDVTCQDLVDGDLEWVDVSDALYLVSGWQDSKGARLEMQRAEEKKIPIFENLVSLSDWIQDWKVT